MNGYTNHTEIVELQQRRDAIVRELESAVRNPHAPISLRRLQTSPWYKDRKAEIIGIDAKLAYLQK